MIKNFNHSQFVCHKGFPNMRYQIRDLMQDWYFDGYCSQQLLRLEEQVKDVDGNWSSDGRYICVTAKTLIENFVSEDSFSDIQLQKALNTFSVDAVTNLDN